MVCSALSRAGGQLTDPITALMLADQIRLLELLKSSWEFVQHCFARLQQGDLHLTPLEYRLLESLARHTGLIVRQPQIIREVWGPERLDDTRSLRVCVKNLRTKIEPDPKRPRYLVTEAGLGYRLRTD